MELLRTPDERFAGLPGFDFPSRYVDDLPGYEGIRVHFIDAGRDEGGGVALCLHGNPAWSYLYRKMIPPFVRAGLRVIAPDLIGFGRSDKPVAESAHTFDFHRGMLLRLIERLDLKDAMLLVQDWGGLLGLTLPPELPHAFSRMVLMNTALATGERPTEGFLQWREYSNRTPDLPVGRLIARGTPDMSAAECAAYDAPFPDARYKAALRAFPNLVPDRPDAPGAEVSRKAARWFAEHWGGQSFMAVGMRDPVLGPAVMERLRRLVPGCPRPFEVADGGHFVQEWGEPIAAQALKVFGMASGS